ncbi:hypothetical protein BV22DRAFT_643358 [Leucogyrophana mollusca]|uniref:Uncharacterized protein n=1 Tax=Leucogyrophana mollusca TaxID=85980 RepID=A0ACB8BA23_9AGAM|nr:hypothetical protein BV22DRAFT_643358 [Leucogyrophana mollusca]
MVVSLDQPICLWHTANSPCDAPTCVTGEVLIHDPPHVRFPVGPPTSRRSVTSQKPAHMIRQIDIHDSREHNEIKSRFLFLHVDSDVVLANPMGCIFDQCVRPCNHAFPAAAPRDRNDPRYHAATLRGALTRTQSVQRRHGVLECLLFREALPQPRSL